MLEDPGWSSYSLSLRNHRCWEERTCWKEPLWIKEFLGQHGRIAQDELDWLLDLTTPVSNSRTSQQTPAYGKAPIWLEKGMFTRSCTLWKQKLLFGAPHFASNTGRTLNPSKHVYWINERNIGAYLPCSWKPKLAQLFPLATAAFFFYLLATE